MDVPRHSHERPHCKIASKRVHVERHDRSGKILIQPMNAWETQMSIDRQTLYSFVPCDRNSWRVLCPEMREARYHGVG